jgi:hypothetical protein
VHGVSEEIERLRAELAGMRSDDRDRSVVRAELDRLNREQVFAPRPGWDAHEWMAIPDVRYVRPEATMAEEDFKAVVKSFFWMIVAGIVETPAFAAGETAFVSLVRIRREDGDLVISLTCPFDAPLRYVTGLTREDLAGSAGQRLSARLRDVGVEHRYMLVEDLLVPIVVHYDSRASHVLLTNQNHFSNPDQFISPWLCSTTSGFLNFIGAQELRESRAVLVADPEAIMNEGLDEWFRWLYCTMETGKNYESRRLLVRRDNPEEWVYDYDGV